MTNNKKNNNSLTSSNEDDVPAVVCVCLLSLSLLAFLGVDEVLPFGPTDFSLNCYRPLDLDNFSLSFFFLIQRWNNGGKRRPLAELCPLQTNLPAPSFCPSQIGAGREGQTLNPEAGLGGVICRADQIPRGCLREGSLLTDQLVTDVPDSWKGALPPSPPKHTPPPTAPLVQLLHSNLPGERQQWVGPLTPADWALTQVPKVQPRQTRDAKPKSCCWQWYSNLIWVIAVVGNGSRSSPLCDLGGGMLWSDQGVEMGKIWARQ